jgi:hypothetical protein
MRNWQEKHGNLDKFNLQPVLPIVLYTGTRTWDKLGNLWELVNLGAEFQQWIPALEPLFLNVRQASDAELANGGVFGLLLRLLQQRRAPLAVFRQTLGAAVSALEGLVELDRGRRLDLLSYIEALIYNDREVPEQEPLIEKMADAVHNDAHRKEVFDMGKTIAEHLISQGREEGEVLTQRRMLLRLLRNKFGKIPAATVKQIEATERIDLLDAWFDQALAGKTLEELSFTDG